MPEEQYLYAQERRIQPYQPAPPPRTFGTGLCAAGLSIQGSRGSRQHRRRDHVVPPLPGSVVEGSAGRDRNHGRADHYYPAPPWWRRSRSRRQPTIEGNHHTGAPAPDIAGGIGLFTVDNVVGSGAQIQAPARVSDWSVRAEVQRRRDRRLNGSQYVANGSPVVGVSRR